MSDAAPPLAFTVEEGSVGTRIDALLAELSGASRAQVKRWIDAGRVKIGDEVVRPSRKVEFGESIEARPLEPVEMALEPEAIPLDVLFEDEHLIVLDKPAGLVVHPAPGHPDGTLVNALLAHCGDLAGIGGVLRPGIVHRLDRGTTGVMVAAKDDETHQGLALQFAEHTIDRLYRTLVRGMPRADEGRIDRPIGRHPRDRKRMSVEAKGGKASITNWRVLRRFREAMTSELEVRPQTGRTHQIRVHLSSAGLPLVGDPVYGRARGNDARLGRPALHAAHLGFDHPVTGRRLSFEPPLPDDLIEWIADLGPDEVVE
ncbi:MAG: RluA family pseudouridine synthase [Deltaproteobacteria bacterium]|nr:RluA family pseudouridine synthase [Deltaproteobacteria bacterium]